MAALAPTAWRWTQRAMSTWHISMREKWWYSPQWGRSSARSNCRQDQGRRPLTWPLAVRMRRLSILDIIGDSVYLLYAHLSDLTRQTTRVPGRDRTETRRVCACAAGLCCGLYPPLSARQDLGRQGAPTPGRRRRQRRLAADGRQAVLHPRLPEDQSAANHARLAIRSEPTPDQLLDSSFAPRLATRLSRSRHGARARREPGRHQPPGA